MGLVVYERVGHEGRRPSPFSWRVRYALAHKEIDVEYRPTRFADVVTIEHLSTQSLVPILVDGDTVVHDSWNIATYLEDRYPDRPSLFEGSTGRATTRLLNHWCDTALHLPLRLFIYPDFTQCLALEDRDYFVRSREREYGMTAQQIRDQSGRWRSEFEAACAPLEVLFTEQEFVGGNAPRYADYVVFSHFLRAHLCCPKDVVRAGSALAGWRQRMFGLFDGLAQMFPGHPAQSSQPSAEQT